MSDQTIKMLTGLIEKYEEVSFCILFGSAVEQQQNFDSDIDVAVAGEQALSAEQKQQLIEELAVNFKRPVDLIDLQMTSGMLLHQILTKGEVIFCRDHQLYAELIKKCYSTKVILCPTIIAF